MPTCRLLTFFEISLWDIIRASNGFYPDSVGPDLGPNCLQSLQQTTKVAVSKERVILH